MINLSTMKSPFSHPLYVMAKPVGSQCNLACRYCYYLDKKSLYPQSAKMVMDEGLLERFVSQYIAAQTQREVLFVWHGGEPLLLSLDFYRKVIALQLKHARGHVIDNCLQTNGTLLTDDWCKFLKDNNWLVGVSIDGPQVLHDTFRKNRRGRGSFADVVKGIDMLNRHGVEWNAMAVVNSLNAEHPKEFYHFFRDMGCRYIQFTPIVERVGNASPLVDLANDDKLEMTPETVSPRQWGYFLCSVFDEWVGNDVGEYFIQIFDATLANWLGVEPGVCSMARSCGNALAIEHNGDVFSCDHFVFPDYRLGNISDESLVALAYGERQNEFRRMKGSLPAQCRRCSFGFACHGECPKNRLCHTVDGEAGLNYLCSGYLQFFRHVAPYMDFMAGEWRADRAPANVMEAIRQGLFSRQGPIGGGGAH